MSLETFPFPEVNATLNSISTCFIVAGWILIRSGRKRAHIVCMICALAVSTVFLTSYLTYHLNFDSVKFTAQGWIRPVYFAILVSHIILAIVIVPMIIATVVPAIRTRWDKHKRIARWTMPLWLYVSVTGVLVYFMLYQWFRPDAALQ